MKAQRLLEVQPLPWRVARTLFRELVGKDTLISTPEIFELAQSTVERCQGFPSAIITTGQTLAACKNFKEWEQLTQELGDLIEEEILGVEDPLFHVLKQSYNRLLNDITKLYFIYCFIFSKEYKTNVRAA